MGCNPYQRKNQSHIRSGKLQQRLSIGPYSLKRQSKLAEGAFGIIWQCKDAHSGVLYALKEICLKDKHSKDAYQNEVNLLNRTKEKQLQGQIKMKATAIDKDMKYGEIGMLLLQLGSTTLLDQINSYDFTQREVIIILKEISQALAELHSMEVAHMDVKPENMILVGKTYKICDFGSVLTKKKVYSELTTIQKEQLQEYIEHNTTLMYRPPQLIKPEGQVIGPQADMWMFGCICYILAFGSHPFQDKNPQKILNCEINYPSEGFMTDLVKNLLVKNPSQRLPSHKIVERLIFKLDSTV